MQILLLLLSLTFASVTPATPKHADSPKTPPAHEQPSFDDGPGAGGGYGK